MAQNKVEVLLTAKDEISGQLKGIVAGFAATLGGLAIAAISIGKLKDGITSAASAQTSLIVSAGDVGSLMGVSYGKALSVVKGIQTEISKMAAALPGETAGYSQIANGITATMALGAKGNLKKFRDDTVELTRTLGMLAATKGVDMTQAAGAANKLVSGSAGLGELFGTNDIFQKNPLFRLYLNAELKNLGKQEKDWEKLSQDVRTKVITLAGKRSFSSEMLSNLEGTTESLIQGIKTALFDDQVGIFGFLREVKALGAGRNALNTVQGALQSLMSLSESAGKVLAKYGLSFDPMAIVGHAFDFANEAMNAINQAITGNGLSGLVFLFRGFDSSLKKINPRQIGKGINDALGLVLKGIQSFDVDSAAKFLSEGLALWSMQVNDLLKDIDFGQVIRILDEGLLKLVNTFLAVLQDSIGNLFNSLGKEYSDGWKATVKQSGLEDWGKDKSVSDGINKMLGVPKSSDSPQSTLPTLTTPGSLPVINNSNSTGVNTTASNFSPVIQVTGVAQNLQETADYVLSAMNSKYMEYQAGILA